MAATMWTVFQHGASFAGRLLHGNSRLQDDEDVKSVTGKWSGRNFADLPPFAIAFNGVSEANSCCTPTGSCATLMWQGNMSDSTDNKLDLLQGTLDVMVLQTLSTMGSLHGYGIARRIEQTSGNQVLLNQGTIYASLLRLQQRGWISAEWGTSENNRKAKFYSITKRGSKQLATETAGWARLADVMSRVLNATAEDGK